MKFHSITIPVLGACSSRDKSYIRSGVSRHNYYCILYQHVSSIVDDMMTLEIGYIDSKEYNVKFGWRSGS